MFRLTIISVLIAVAVARTPGVRPAVPTFDGKIVGGEDTTIEQFPHQVSLQAYGSHTCGASIISSTKILTAAHCTNGVSASALSIRAGSTYRGMGGQVIQVRAINQHPEYDTKTTDMDVSILELASPLKLGSGVQPIALANPGSSVPTGTWATVSGWGRLYDEGPLPTTLQMVDVPKIDKARCQVLYRNLEITANMMCFGFEQGGQDSCQGDSGGPLVHGGKQIGVVSWGIGCAEAGFPGVYADLAAPKIVEHLRRAI